MPEDKIINPIAIQDAMNQSRNRLRAFRLARALFIKEYVGQYYMDIPEYTGRRPLNLIHSALRAIIPNIVMKNPQFYVSSDNNELWGRADSLTSDINSAIDQMNFSDTLRAVMVDAFFGFGVFHTGLHSTGTFLTVDDMRIDPGRLMAERIDLDDLIFDPTCTRYLFTDGAFIGHYTRIPRQRLLDKDGYDHDILKKIPNALEQHAKQNVVSDISKIRQYGWEFSELRDLIDVACLYFPKQQAIMLLPDPKSVRSDKPIFMTDYHGPDNGPYDFLTFSQPVPNNPFPVAPVSLWYDMHICANDIFRKAMDQALRQKDGIIYNPLNADTAQDVVDARDGFTIAGDPQSVKEVSTGGQNPKNMEFTGACQTWFNYLAGNPEMLAGLQSQQETATAAQIQSGQANISIQDSTFMTEQCVERIGYKIAWHLIDDPLNIDYSKSDWLEFMFELVARSMIKLDPQVRARRIQEFFTNVVPQLANATMLMTNMGVGFNIQEAMISVAESLGIESEIARILNDPYILQKMQNAMIMGPAKASKTQGTTNMPGGGTAAPGVSSPATTPTAPQQQNQIAQQASGQIGFGG
ncbi:MAG: hypothetical protein KAJ19_12180 [Gammaproteobacteria bacterium]|nr:hypothetical protein [Gammaproteobacteria bacterium]